MDSEIMASGYTSQLLNFFGIKDTRRYLRICIRCGSDNIKREQNLIECRECGKTISIKSHRK